MHTHLYLCLCMCTANGKHSVKAEQPTGNHRLLVHTVFALQRGLQRRDASLGSLEYIPGPYQNCIMHGHRSRSPYIFGLAAAILACKSEGATGAPFTIAPNKGRPDTSVLEEDNRLVMTQHTASPDGWSTGMHEVGSTHVQLHAHRAHDHALWHTQRRCFSPAPSDLCGLLDYMNMQIEAAIRLLSGFLLERSGFSPEVRTHFKYAPVCANMRPYAQICARYAPYVFPTPTSIPRK